MTSFWNQALSKLGVFFFFLVVVFFQGVAGIPLPGCWLQEIPRLVAPLFVVIICVTCPRQVNLDNRICACDPFTLRWSFVRRIILHENLLFFSFSSCFLL